MAWYPPTVTVAPAVEPVTTDDLKAWGRFDSADDEPRLESAVESARSEVESLTGTHLVEQTVAVKCDSLCDLAHVPLAPVRSVVVTYVDGDGNAQTLSSDLYELRADGLQTSIVPKYGATWPAARSGSRVTVTAVCGYEEVPPQVLQAIRLRAMETLDGGKTDETLAAFEALLANHRRFG